MSLASSTQEEEVTDFVTLGMFIIDEIHFQPPRPPVKDILGGAGTYAALGARIFSAPPLSRRVGWIVDAGSDFPSHLRHEIDEWQTSCWLRETPWRKTTRGWNSYNTNEQRGFKYLTPKLRLDEESLDDRFLASRSFHLICSPLRCIDLITNIMRKRAERFAGDFEVPIWIWEPVPDLCTPAELESCQKALKIVDIVSPNHIEICNFYGKQAHDPDGNIKHDSILECCRIWVNSGIGQDGKGVVVTRAGKDGCFLLAKGRNPHWIPAYHQQASAVVDPTGGGNCFLGALGAMVARESEFATDKFEAVKRASLFGSVAASFAIEQVGLPQIKQSTESEQELWNGENAWARLATFSNKLDEMANHGRNHLAI